MDDVSDQGDLCEGTQGPPKIFPVYWAIITDYRLEWSSMNYILPVIYIRDDPIVIHADFDLGDEVRNIKVLNFLHTFNNIVFRQ